MVRSTLLQQIDGALSGPCLHAAQSVALAGGQMSGDINLCKVKSSRDMNEIRNENPGYPVRKITALSAAWPPGMYVMTYLRSRQANCVSLRLTLPRAATSCKLLGAKLTRLVPGTG